MEIRKYDEVEVKLSLPLPHKNLLSKSPALLRLMMKKLRYKNYNKRLITRDNSNVQSHDQEESKLNSTINAICGAHTLTSHLTQQKNSFSKSNVATMKSK